MSRAVIIAPGLTVPQQNALTQYFVNNNNEYGFWHWGSDTWLISTSTDPLDVVALRELIRNVIAPGANVVILKVEPSAQPPNWVTFGPQEWGKWMKESWEKKPSGS
jgi:hypothetical protein